MSEELRAKHCVPCRGGIPALTRSEAEAYLAQVPDWSLPEDAHHIERRFRFDDFAQAMAFVNRVGELAEHEGHHPEICFGWGWAGVRWYTHKIAGLHENDFIMAAKVDRLLGG
jgi:4a-hydroxytetrahydrobiopterin dehydratase